MGTAKSFWNETAESGPMSSPCSSIRAKKEGVSTRLPTE
jgi:hypothetical protein